MSIIDTHNHLYFKPFQSNTQEVITTAKNHHIEKQILIGCDEISNLAALNLNKEYPDTFRTVLGLHPCDVDKLGERDSQWHDYPGLEAYRPQNKEFETFFRWLEALYLQNRDLVVGFGETGFDQYHRRDETLLALQVESFSHHVYLCEKYKKTLVIHSRNTTDTGLKILKEKKSQIQKFPVIWHCFCDGIDTAEALVDLGVFLGIGGIATYPKSKHVRDAIKRVPIEFLVTETDAPFLTPQKARKNGEKTNAPHFLPEIVALIAEVKGLEVDQCEAILYENGLRAFGLTHQ